GVQAALHAAKPDSAEADESKKPDRSSSPTVTPKLTPVPSAGDEAKKKLSEGVAAVKKTVSKEVEAGPSWMWIVYLGVAVLVLWVVIGLLRALFGSKKQQSGYYPPPRPGERGGGRSVSPSHVLRPA